jgi:hypothetical protein
MPNKNKPVMEVLQPKAVFPIPFFHGGPPIIFHIPNKPYLWNCLEASKKKAVCSMQRLLQYCQLPDKNSNHILRDIWNFSQYFKIPPFPVEMRTMLCRTLVGRHWPKVFVVFLLLEPVMLHIYSVLSSCSM